MFLYMHKFVGYYNKHITIIYCIINMKLCHYLVANTTSVLLQSIKLINVQQNDIIYKQMTHN
ncbi:ORF-106 [Catopsilia pomona nucleopolyhedrovirus]|uniref:ORF-106 n=1 Tax=Catopsilia pomona nucleopolyhedrovirus TaxID=1850906 RepID=A0A172WZI6_9ABAC|nr:ORF-106 [Catopsilia pomona nucleopolyhedrovirus]ANF29754.1 ORF-106 [Catopsilia pomona nucleopolyhedrovirus]